ncbi:MAG: valine--tRNA ligase [Candidatus Pacebacteria bacterium]|nr:valine--tRNA ligase [Candidatus Paceibacterota bacterium]
MFVVGYLYMKQVPENLLQPYNAQEVEPGLYAAWEESGYFNPDNLPGERKEAFTIVMPPPNANGSLHAGHALFVTIQDILTRYHRMNGKNALWLPGSDHAGFETQVVYEKKLEKEGRSRFDMKREDLYKEILDFTLSNKTFMEGQLRQLGASCDWSRSLFTLDERVIKTVYNTFSKLDQDGLLYRGKRIVNWCPKHQTSLSNLETTHVSRKDPFYYFKYGPFTIGTVRPETKFGDKYVVMHPDDERYKEFTHGQKITVEWINGPIEATIIKDEASDPEFGTGVMTITPWHSGIDFDIAKRHNLDMEQIIDERGKLLPVAGEFAGMNIKDARAKIVEKLESKGLLVKTDIEYSHEVSVCYKCEREIEPQVKAQWFVTMKPLAEKAVTALDKGEFKILTDQHEKVFRHWMGNVQDWNISRQIVWGIPIPAKICDACDKGFVDTADEKTICESCDGLLRQETDTFDTWFSSGQWPLTTTGFPDSSDFKKFYPTSVMETAADILFFWVARMVMFGLYLTDEVPFKDVYLHGLVRDAQGKKMSKSKGNVISPLEVSNEYGTDALRMGLIVNNAPGVDMNLDPKKVGAYKKFANKIWNATRFVLEKTSDYEEIGGEFTEEDSNAFDVWMAVKKDITDDLENYRLHLASQKIYDYFWKTFCDELIETRKMRILENKDKESAQKLLLTLLREQLIVLHPFMPFITEEIWKYIKKGDDNLLIVTKW